jgi:hypothetical protein
LSLTQGLGPGGKYYREALDLLPAETTVDYVRAWR